MDDYDESTETGLPMGACGYCGGAHHPDEHATDGELVADAREAEHDEREPDDY